jgi:hypothetical protein
VPAVQLRDSPDQRQANAESALRSIQAALALYEQIEDTRQQLRFQTEARVAHAEDRLAVLASQ